jgi:hypothetical protein
MDASEEPGGRTEPAEPAGPAVDAVDLPAGTDGRRTRTWIVVVLVAVALVIGAATVVVLVTDRTGIHDGPGTATFTWTPVHQGVDATAVTAPPQPFTGDVDGVGLSGTATMVFDPTAFAGAAEKLPTGPVPAFRYRGTLAGTAFDLTLDYHFPGVPFPTDPASAQAAVVALRITVTGSYGRSAVHATVSVPSAGGPTAAHPATFSGTVGHWRVRGTIPEATGGPAHQTATAHFVVSG